MNWPAEKAYKKYDQRKFIPRPQPITEYEVGNRSLVICGGALKLYEKGVAGFSFDTIRRISSGSGNEKGGICHLGVDPCTSAELLNRETLIFGPSLEALLCALVDPPEEKTQKRV